MTEKIDIERLFKAHYSRMFKLANSLVHDSELARDIVHDVFAALLDADSFGNVGEGYLLRAVRNRCLNAIRDCDIHRRVTKLYYINNEDYDGEDWPDEETMAQIERMIATDLTPQARQVIRLRFADGMPFAKVALTMGISQTAVFRHLGKALTFIRKKIYENG